MPLQGDAKGNLRTITMGATSYRPSPSSHRMNALRPNGVINPSGSCQLFVGTTGDNLFAVWGIGPPGQYIEVIDGVAAPPTGTRLVAEPPSAGAYGFIGGGQIGASGQWTYTSQAPFPDVPMFGIEVCVSSTAPPLYTAYVGGGAVVMTANLK
jgi:hypothetical protein